MTHDLTAEDLVDIGETLNDGIQDLAWSPTSNVLVSGNWDNYVRCWEVQQQGTQFNAVAKAEIAHDGPVLCTAFSGVRLVELQL